MRLTDIRLSATQAAVLKKCGKRKFNGDTASPEEQQAEMELIGIACAYEEQNDLIDERIDYTYDSNLLVWFYDKAVEAKII